MEGGDSSGNSLSWSHRRSVSDEEAEAKPLDARPPGTEINFRTKKCIILSIDRMMHSYFLDKHFLIGKTVKEIPFERVSVFM